MWARFVSKKPTISYLINAQGHIQQTAVVKEMCSELALRAVWWTLTEGRSSVQPWETAALKTRCQQNVIVTVDSPFARDLSTSSHEACWWRLRNNAYRVKEDFPRENLLNPRRV